MMSLMRRRAEAARHKRIDHVFMKADDNSSGKITINQMLRCFALNGEVIFIPTHRLLIIQNHFLKLIVRLVISHLN